MYTRNNLINDNKKITHAASGLHTPYLNNYMG
jgi:hypothetical protein